MREYRVNRKAFYDFGNGELRDYFNLVLPYCRVPMEQLMDRYGLKNKSIVSVGGGSAFEEYYLSQRNRVTIIDIDEHGLIEPHLKTLPHGDFGYIVGDATGYRGEPFDALYLSSFTPDELYRRRKSARIFGDPRIANKLGLPWWRPEWEPFHPLISQFLELTRDIAIIQSYASVVPGNDPTLRTAAEGFFRKRGFTLDRIYFNHNSPHWYVIAASRNPRPWGPDITQIFGRSQVVRAV